MDDYLYCLIYPAFIRTIQINTGDVIAAPPETSVISAADWSIMSDQAGSEEVLLNSLGVAHEIPESEIQVLQRGQ
jgi:hypothetical protein